jgi:hypothetical protein
MGTLYRIHRLRPTFEQEAPRSLKVGDDKITLRIDPTGASVGPLPICSEQLEPGR